MAFYVAKVEFLLDEFSFYTLSWYFGYEILRFYPPLSTLLPYLIVRISGDLMSSYYVLCCVFYTIYCVGIYFFIRRFLESKTAGLFAGALWSITHVNMVSFQGYYWETARLFGTAMVPWAMYFADRAIESGRRRWIVAFVLTVSYTFLSNMLSAFDLLLLLVPFLVIRGIIIPPVTRQVRSEVRNRTMKILGVGAVGFLGMSLWWYVPALLPHGIRPFVSDYIGELPPLSEILLQVNPPRWMPAIQLPITLLGLAGAATAIYKQERKGMMFVTLFFISIVAAHLIEVQPQRLILNIGFSLNLLTGCLTANLSDLVKRSLRSFTHLKNRHGEIRDVVIILILASLFYIYQPRYSGFAIVDDTYKLSDEYISATWLRNQVDSDYRVYVMYGKRYRGSQWLNAFYPQVRQVLGGFDQGARVNNDAPFTFDDVIKNSSNPNEAYDLARNHHVRYLVVDKTWMQATASQAYSKFEDQRFFRPVGSINMQLEHAEVFEVLGVAPLKETKTEYEYWDEYRFLGLSLSITSLIVFIYGIMRCNTQAGLVDIQHRSEADIRPSTRE